MPYEDMKLRKPLTKWYGQYKQVDFEVCRWQFESDDRYIWNFYLYLYEAQLEPECWQQLWLTPRDDIRGRINYDWYENRESILHKLPWHGGLSYYQKYNSPDDPRGVLKVGCAYNHHGDELVLWDLDYMQYDVRCCIDTLHELTTVKSRCRWCVEYGLPEVDGFTTRHGDFMHYTCARAAHEAAAGGSRGGE